MRMGNIAGDKMFGHLDRVLNDRRPITADIFLTNSCNNRCPYCTYRRWGLDAGVYSMAYGEFVAYAERLLELGVRGFILTGGGEPMVCGDFRKITGWLESRSIPYGVNTNFNLLECIRPDYIKVSLDGWDEDSYERCRGVRRYGKVRDHIVRYGSWKRRHSPRTSLGIQMLVQRGDVGDIKRFWLANRDLPVDYMVFRPVESTGGICYLDEHGQGYVEDATKAIEEIGEKDGRVVRNFKWDLLGQQEESCTAQWAQIAVNERGEVMYCCHKPYQVVGHVLDEDILEKKSLAGTDMELCDVPCRMTAPNRFMAQVEKDREDACFI